MTQEELKKQEEIETLVDEQENIEADDNVIEEKELSDAEKLQKAEEEYNKAYNEAYNNYLRKMGYKVKEPWTLKRVKNLAITILVIIGVCLLIWILPPTRNFLINIYNENFIVKSLVDIVAMLIDAIVSTFKG